MVTDQQVRLLMKLSKTKKTLSTAAAKAGMDEKTVRKYRSLKRLPSKVQVEHTWRTRKDPFAKVWAELGRSLGSDLHSSGLLLSSICFTITLIGY